MTEQPATAAATAAETTAAAESPAAESPAAPAGAAAPAPRRRFAVQRGGCGCEGKPSPTARQTPPETSR
ncbi:hypothetical protein [Streptomyces sp. NPDC012888]|uniref:hypothetical protein n=1 Tax=Streptomyces sp. NPDC012888 TaxID=3364855 RepID=UPI00367C6892